MKASRRAVPRLLGVPVPGATVASHPSVPWTAMSDGLRVTVRVTPKAKRSGVAGVGVGANGQPALLVSVAAPPADGAANHAVVSLMSDMLHVGRLAVTIVSGAASRHKVVDLRGDPDRLVERLSASLAAARSR